MSTPVTGADTGGHRRPWQRFVGGLRLPLELRSELLTDPAARALYRRVTRVQAAITIICGVAIAGGLFAFVFWLAHQHGSRVVWSASGIAIHSGNAADTPAGVNMDTGWRLAAGAAYVLFGTLTLAEGVVIALSREYHDQLGRRASLLARIEPEDVEAVPRLRLNPGWVYNRVKRKLRGARVFIAGLPVLAIVGLLPVVGSYAYAAVTFVWSLYWLAVFAAGKSARAWDDVDTVGPPFFLRAAARVPVVRWYGRLWHRLTRAVFAPCRRVEEAPWELAGLAAARLFGTLPVLYLFYRPFLPVAAAAIITRARASGAPQST